MPHAPAREGNCDSRLVGVEGVDGALHKGCKLILRWDGHKENTGEVDLVIKEVLPKKIASGGAWEDTDSPVREISE